MVSPLEPAGKPRKTAPKRRRPGTGTVYYHEAVSLWRGFYRPRDGEAINVSGKTYRAAADALDKAVAEHKAGLRTPVSRGTVAEYLRAWLAGKAGSVRAQTMLSYESHVRVHLVPALGARRLSDLTAPEVGALLAKIQKGGASPQTAQHVRATLRSALSDACRQGLVVRNAAALASAPRVRQYEAAFLDSEQAAAFLEACQGHQLGALFTVLLGMGLRRSEALGLQWGDVDPAARTLAIRRSAQARPGGGRLLEETKSKSSRRTLRMPAFVLDALERLRLLAPSTARTAPVFTMPGGEPVTPNYATRSLPALLEAAGLPRIRLHDLRHSTATLLLERGISSMEVATLLGHSTTRLTDDRYGHLTARMTAAAAAAMDTLQPTPKDVKPQLKTAADDA